VEKTKRAISPRSKWWDHFDDDHYFPSKKSTDGQHRNNAGVTHRPVAKTEEVDIVRTLGALSS
jgi:hypothetical protein